MLKMSKITEKSEISGLFRSSTNILAACVIALSFSAAGLPAEPLDLPGYLDLVKAGNADYGSALKSLVSSEAAASESRLLTTPYLFTGYQWARDKSLLVDPSGTSGSNRLETSFSIGVEARTVIGLGGSVSFRSVFDSVDDLHLPMYPSSVEYYTPSLTFELKQDLLRNFFGRETRAQRDAILHAAAARTALAEFQMRQILSQAEILYWRTSLASEVVRVQEDLLERSRRMLEWVSDRVDRQLQDLSDLLQSQADVKFRTLELESSRDDESRLRRAFSLMAGLSPSEPARELRLPARADFVLPDGASNRIHRSDIRALEEMDAVYRMESVLKKESVTPTLSAFFSATWNGLESDLDSAMKDVGKFKYDLLAAGIRLQAPFDLPSLFKLRKSYSADYESRRSTYRQRAADAESERLELLARIPDMIERLKVSDELVKIQLWKADNERDRLLKGNTVTLQVLLFEQDLGRSKLMRLDLQARLLEMLSRLRMYE